MLFKFAIVCGNNGVRYKFCQRVWQLGNMIQEYANPDKKHKWKSLQNIKQWLTNLYQENHTETPITDQKLCVFVKFNACLVKALLIEKQYISMYTTMGMYNIIYWNQYVYEQSNQYRDRLIHYSRLYDHKSDIPFNVAIDDIIHTFIPSIPPPDLHNNINPYLYQVKEKNNNILLVSKTFRIPMQENMSKGRLIIDQHCDALIYFYPNGNKQCAPGYMASDVQLELRDDKDKWIYLQSLIKVSWQCGSEFQTQVNAVHNYLEQIEASDHWTFGIDNIFKKTYLQSHQCLIKIKIEIKPKNYQIGHPLYCGQQTQEYY